MSIYLRLSERYQAALETFDPLRGDRLMRIADPWAAGGKDGRIRWGRLALVLLVIIGPAWLFSSIPSVSFGGKLTGDGGIVADLGLYVVYLFMAFSFLLIPVARRILGDLPRELERRGVLGPAPPALDRLFTPKGQLLRLLVRASRTDGYGGWIWYGLLVTNQLSVYFGIFLTDGRATWHSSPATPGSLFYPLRVGSEQPNLAGLWSFLVQGPVGLYLVVLVARLIIVFACLCSRLAWSKKLSILPPHPDSAGGLQPIGQVALLLSLFAFVLGIDLAGMTLNEMMVNRALPSAGPHEGANLLLLYALWGLYLVFGSILFFLPLAPLRARMATAKRRYLIAILKLQAVAGREHEHGLHHGAVEQSTLQRYSALDPLFRSASEMAVWPFDRKTFLRYAGLFLSPLIPLLVDQLPRLFRWVEALKGVPR